MAKRLKSATDAVAILHRRFYQGKPARLKNLEEARANEEIARKIHDQTHRHHRIGHLPP